MKKIDCLLMNLFLFLTLYPASAQRINERFNTCSAFVADSFQVYITLPEGYQRHPDKKFAVVCYLDASLKAGKELRKMLEDTAYKKNTSDVIFAGIGHNPRRYLALRNRDFTTPYQQSGDSLISTKKDYGQMEHFYRFLTTELMPLIKNRYRVNDRWSIVGHSLGGLFVFYCLFKKEHLFTNYIALSPSLWVNNYNIYQFEKKYHDQANHLNAGLYLSCGSLEFLNKILQGNRQMNQLLQQRKYKGLHYEYAEHPMENHNSETAPSMKQVLKTYHF